MFIGDFFRWISGTKKCKDIQELIRYISVGDIDHLAHWIMQRIVYTKDIRPEDEWKDSNRTIKDGFGDCEDTARIGLDVISTWPRWRADILCLYNDVKGHAVCTFERPDGKKGIIEGKARIYDKETTWEEITEKVFPWATRQLWRSK